MDTYPSLVFQYKYIYKIYLYIRGSVHIHIAMKNIILTFLVSGLIKLLFEVLLWQNVKIQLNLASVPVVSSTLQI